VPLHLYAFAIFFGIFSYAYKVLTDLQIHIKHGDMWPMFLARMFCIGVLAPWRAVSRMGFGTKKCGENDTLGQWLSLIATLCLLVSEGFSLTLTLSQGSTAGAEITALVFFFGGICLHGVSATMD
jgi:hypothetical protein